MKIFLLLSLFIPQALFAEICLDNPDEATTLAASLSLPNCNKEELVTDAKDGFTDSLCTDCKGKFEALLGEKVNKPEKSRLQQNFLDTALKEYKKNLMNNLLSVIKMRSLPSTGAKFQSSLASCKMIDNQSLASECKSPSAKKLLTNSSLLSDLSKEVSNELAKILSTNEAFNPKPTILTRNNSCSIPEKKILYLTMSTVEEEFSPDLIRFIKNSDPSKYQTLEDFFSSEEFGSNYRGEYAQLNLSIKSHPLLSTLKNTSSFISFFKEVSSPEEITNLRASLYSSNNGQQFDNLLAQNCENSLKALKASICSDDFENGSINTDPFTNFEKLELATASSGDFVTSEDDINKNIKLLGQCEISPSEKLNLTLINKEIGSNLAPNHQEMTIKDFGVDKFESEIGLVKSNLCQNAGKPCDETTFSCKVLRKYNDSLKDPNSLDSRLASSSNSEVNSLLRSMIGIAANLEPKTKEILIAEGIIPREDGTITPQPEIPERAPDFFQKEVQRQSQGTVAQRQATAPQAVRTVQPVSNRTPAGQQTQEPNYSFVGDLNGPSAPEGLDDLARDAEELRRVQDEIRRRLTDLPGRRQPSRAEARQIARDSFRRNGRTLTPAQENYFTDRIINAPATHAQAALPAAPDNGRRAEVSEGDSEIERWRKNRMNEALMGMAGAQQVAGSGTSGQAPGLETSPSKEMTKVALNISEDPQITLSDIFKSKLDQNDSETQLLKVLLSSKNNFLLQVRSVNFKVIFNEDNRFNLLLQSGDQQEAERIRPQLEMFLRRLRV